MRRLLPVLSITASAVLLMIALAPACGDQCNRAEDCATGEVCYAGVCEPLTQDYVRCGSNSDCDPNGRFVCRAGRCEIQGAPPPTPADGGDASTGPDGAPGPDGGDAMPGMDAMNMDATSTIADGGDAGPDGGPLPDAAVDSGMPPTSLDMIDGNLDGLQIIWRMATNATIQGNFVVSTNSTFIQGDGNLAGPIEGRRVEVNFPTATPGMFTCDMPGVVIEWEDATGTLFRAAMGVAGSSCTITITSYGAVGEAILGTFSGTLVATVIGVPPPVNMTPPINGTFDVLRDPDLP